MNGCPTAVVMLTLEDERADSKEALPAIYNHDLSPRQQNLIDSLLRIPYTDIVTNELFRNRVLMVALEGLCEKKHWFF
jgi:hypothetical protein